jgi:hypothetical protein
VESTVDPLVLGPLMIVVTTLWFGAMSWAGMHEDDTPRGPTPLPKPGYRGPWWTNEGFEEAQEPVIVPVVAKSRAR